MQIQMQIEVGANSDMQILICRHTDKRERESKERHEGVRVWGRTKRKRRLPRVRVNLPYPI